MTNVRTIFGTLYINSNWIIFVLYTLSLSSLIYLIRVAMIRFNNIYIYVVYFFLCGMLFMGWFDLYFAGIVVIELPLMVMVLLLLEKVLHKKNNDVENESHYNTD